MATLITRLVKGFPLTNAELDTNFDNLNTELSGKLNSSLYTAENVLTKLLTVDDDMSGLNACTLLGLVPTPANEDGTIVQRDSIGNFAASEITSDLVGNVTGDLTGDSTGLHTGNVTGNLTGNSTGYHLGNVTGDVTGDLTGNVTGDVVGNVLGDLTGNVTGDVVGDLTGNVTGDVVGDLTGNVTGDLTGDSTGLHTGNVTGNVTGNLTGNVTGNLTGNVTGNVSGSANSASISTTQAPGTNNTTIATTAFTKKAVDDAVTIINSQFATLGTMSVQNANNVLISGGAISGIALSGSTITGSTVNGIIVGTNAQGAKTISTSMPSGGSNGDVWYRI